MPLTPGTTQRVYTCQPGTNNDVWNIPIGSGAIAGLATDPDTISARVGGFINPLNNFGSAIWDNYSPTSISATFVGIGADYERPGYVGQGTPFMVTAHVLPGSYPPGPWAGIGVLPAAGDNQYIFHDNTGVNAGTEWQFGPFIYADQANPFSASTGAGPFGSLTQNFGGSEQLISDTYAQDWETGNANFTQAAGVIRNCDLTNPNATLIPGTSLPEIQHVLRYSHAASSYKANSSGGTNFPSANNTLNPNSWPQLYEDYQDNATNPGNFYTGNLIYGTQLYIPIGTTMPSGLSAAGQEIFWTLQHYGSIARDTADGGYHLTADQNVPSSWINDLGTDLPKLVALLVPMRNQHQGGQSFTTNPANGPGTRLDAGPPPLAPLVESGQITPTSFSFTLPGLSPSAAATISVQDVNNTSATGTSNAFAVGTAPCQ